MLDKVNLDAKFALFDEQWTPKIIGELNGQHVKLARVQGEFVWHSHAEEDELFLVHKGELTMRLRDREITLGAGEMFIVPRGVEHSPFARTEAQIVLFEPIGTPHTGAVDHELTVRNQDWI